ncbi:hypothetical protein NM688_g533 [Phlebia brevispora]|uniref:Uncharacterized protein n=1 Tax=Phlebia brevispora TaxID=194682 RepID=A0ACC1TE29_9APHY|nr:hypothetical protein NM688_g533 [Phlebia brevispora]
MGKRKKSTRKPQGPKKREPLETAFTCLFCHHDKSVTVRMDRKEGIAQLFCKLTKSNDQSIPDLTEPIDIYSEWIDAADAAERQAGAPRQAASSSRTANAPINYGSDDE